MTAFVQALLMDDLGVFNPGPPFACEPDFYFGNVQLLLHFDGTNGSRVYTDSSTANRSVSEIGSNGLDTSQKKFGTASLGTVSGDYQLSTVDTTSLRVGGGAFTLETQAYVGTNSGTIAKQWEWEIGFDTSGGDRRIRVRMGSNGSTYSHDNYFPSSGNAYTANTWFHLAVVRSGNTVTAYVDGNSIGSFIFTGVVASTTNGLTIGKVAGGPFVSPGTFLDELRFTVGVARYTANFTPPTLPFCAGTNGTPTPVNGAEALTGISATTATGTTAPLNAFAVLGGQSTTAASGSISGANSNRALALVGQSATVSNVGQYLGGTAFVIPPYPDFFRFPAPSTYNLSVTATSSINQACKIRLLLNADWSVSTSIILADFVRSSSTPAYWLYNSSTPGYTPAQVNNAFAITPLTKAVTSGTRTGTSTFAMVNGVDMSAGAYWEIDVKDSATAEESFFSEYIIISPKTNNPRYGEFNYYGIFYFTIAVSAYGDGGGG